MGNEVKLPCPNPECEGGTEALTIERDPLNTIKFYGWVDCDWCGNRGPTGQSEAKAIEGWNATTQVELIDSMKTDIRRLRNGSRCLKEMSLNVELYGVVQLWKEAAEALKVGDCPPLCSQNLGCTLDICKVHEGMALLQRARELDLTLDMEKTSIHEERDQLRDRVAELEKLVVLNGEREKMLAFTKRLRADFEAKAELAQTILDTACQMITGGVDVLVAESFKTQLRSIDVKVKGKS